MQAWLSEAGVAAGALCGALLVDRAFGEPPVWMHPVVLMGRYLGALGPRLTRCKPAAAFVGGALAWIIGAIATAGLALVAARLLARLPPLMALLGLALLLKPLLAWRMLHDEVAAVEAALQRSLEQGRARLQRLVSREVGALDAAQVREAAIESMAENLNDSVVAPLFWFVVAGLPGAALYRFANTADAMWGYRGRYEWAGKWAARADDLLSWLPARLTALLLCLAAARALRFGAVRRQARATPSPNGGWPMGTMALLLGVRLGKPGVYVLNAGGAQCEPSHAQQALAWGHRAVLLAALLGIASTLATAALLAAGRT
jgi:adenosylcobinamide-phosphate synthase